MVHRLEKSPRRFRRLAHERTPMSPSRRLSPYISSPPFFLLFQNLMSSCSCVFHRLLSTVALYTVLFLCVLWLLWIVALLCIVAPCCLRKLLVRGVPAVFRWVKKLFGRKVRYVYEYSVVLDRSRCFAVLIDAYSEEDALEALESYAVTEWSDAGTIEYRLKEVREKGVLNV